MKLPIRLENAIVKLYNAFHKGELDAMNACGCAVGNLCDNSDVWRQRGVIFGEENRITDFDNKTGYSKKELAAIELIFIYGISNFRETKKFQNCISFYDVRDKQKLKPLHLVYYQVRISIQPQRIIP